MIWATVSSQSCFCWLYRASPSLAAKNIISLILRLAICWCSCVKSFLVLLEDSFCCDQSGLLAKLYYPLPCFILYSKAKVACYSRYFLTWWLVRLEQRRETVWNTSCSGTELFLGHPGKRNKHRIENKVFPSQSKYKAVLPLVKQGCWS